LRSGANFIRSAYLFNLPEHLTDGFLARFNAVHDLLQHSTPSERHLFVRP